MSRVGKIFLYFISSLPLLWTVAILIGALSLTISWRGLYDFGGSFLVHKKEFIVRILPIIYFLFGTPIYSALVTFLKMKNKISTRSLIINISLTLVGILTAYLSIHFDIFCVSGCYID